MTTRRIVILAILYLTALSSFSQTIQRGYVYEYNGKEQKSVLSGVEIVVKGAGSTVSAKDGTFLLQFTTQKPGDQVFVTRMLKKGYELFNKEAVDQWHLSRTGEPFKIVMCRSDRFKKLRDNYWRIASESYNKQYLKAQDQLAKRRKEQTIKEEEYQRELTELRLQHERELKNLDAYVDRFSRIDLSELSSTEQAIIELVQKGEIQLAIERYEEMGLLDQYTKAAKEKQISHDAQLKLDSITAIKEQTVEKLRNIIRNGVYIKRNLKERESALRDLELLMHADPTNTEYTKMWEELNK